jgi:hypothetical protein
MRDYNIFDSTAWFDRSYTGQAFMATCRGLPAAAKHTASGNVSVYPGLVSDRGLVNAISNPDKSGLKVRPPRSTNR